MRIGIYRNVHSVATKMANAVKLFQKTFFVISGASRGIGRAIAIECASKFAAGSVVVLLARSISGLEETRTKILARNPTNVTVIPFAIDLQHPSGDEITNIFGTALSEHNIDDFGLAMIVHNIGTIGDITTLARQFGDDASVWSDYYATNVFSVIALNRAFLDHFTQSTKRRLIVNVTSTCGVKPYKSLALYW